MNHWVTCDIVSAEQEIYSGKVESITVDGTEGQLCVLPGHAPLLTRLNPCVVKMKTSNIESDQFYISGGYLEVQPHHVTVLADTAIRAADIDEAAALEAKAAAEAEIQNQQTDIDYAQLSGRLMQAVAQLRLLEEIKRLNKMR